MGVGGVGGTGGGGLVPPDIAQKIKEATQGFSDELAAAKAQFNLTYTDASGQVVIFIPAPDFSIHDYHKALEELLNELVRFLKEAELTDARLDALLSAGLAEEFAFIGRINSVILTLKTSLQVAEEEINVVIEAQNNNIDNYNDGIDNFLLTVPSLQEEIDAYERMDDAMRDVNLQLLIGNDNQKNNAIDEYNAARDEYLTIANQRNFYYTLYNNGTANYNDLLTEPDGINDRIQELNDDIAFYNSIIDDPDKQIPGTFPLFSPLFASHPPNPTNPPPVIPNGPPFPPFPHFSASDISTYGTPIHAFLPEVTPLSIEDDLFLGDPFAFLITVALLVKTNKLQRILGLDRFLEDLQENFLIGNFRFRPIPDAFIDNQSEVVFENAEEGTTPSSGVGRSIKTMGGKLSVTQLARAFQTGLLQQVEGQTQTPIPPELLDAIRLVQETLLAVSSLTSALATVSELGGATGNVRPSQSLADAILVLSFAKGAVDTFTSDGLRNLVSMLVNSTLPDIDASQQATIVDAALDQIQLTRQLFALTAVTELLGIPQVAINVIRAVEGVPAADLLSATESPDKSVNDVLGDPLTNFLLGADLIDIAPNRRQQVRQAVNLLAKADTLTTQTITDAFLEQGFTQEEADQLATGTQLFLENETQVPNLDTKLTINDEQKNKFNATFLEQVSPERETQVDQAIQNTFSRGDPDSLRDFRQKMGANLIRAGVEPAEAKEIANQAVTTLQPPPSFNASALNQDALKDSLNRELPGQENEVNNAIREATEQDATSKAAFRATLNGSLINQGVDDDQAKAATDAAVISDGKVGPVDKEQMTKDIDKALEPFISDTSTRGQLAQRYTDALTGENSTLSRLNQVAKKQENIEPMRDEIKEDFAEPDREKIAVPLTSLNTARTMVNLGVPTVQQADKKSLDIETTIGTSQRM